MTSSVIDVRATSDRLSRIKSEIHDTHQRVLNGIRQTLVDARALGTLLNEANDLVSYGQWRTWILRNCAFSYESATAYRTIADRWTDLPDDVITIAEALRFIAAARRGRKDAPRDLQLTTDLPFELQSLPLESTGPAAHTDLIPDQKLSMVVETIRRYTLQDAIVRRNELIALRDACDAGIQRAAKAA